MKYIPVCSHNALNSGSTSDRVAPMLLILTNPFMPNVEGNIHETTFQKSGMAAPGHDIPEINNRGTDVNTYIIIHDSR